MDEIEEPSTNHAEITQTIVQSGNRKEQFEDDLNNLLPNNHHRGDIVSANRMLAYCDTVMSTCATFFVFPLRNMKTIDVLMSNSTCNSTINAMPNITINCTLLKNKILDDYLESKYKESILFFFGFFIVLSIWENMINRSFFIKRIDDFILTLVIFEMLVATVLPFSLAIQGHYPNEKHPIIMTCVVLTMLQIIDIGIVLYSFNSPKLLHIDLKEWKKRELQELTIIMIFRPLISLVIIVFGGALSFVHYIASWAFIALLTVMPTIRKLFWYIRRRMNKFEKTTKDSLLFQFSKGRLTKERVETVSDAAIAIVACIIIVDITVDTLPKLIAKDTTKANLNNTIAKLKPEVYRFLVIFCLVSALWYINHTVLHLFKKINSIMFYFQKLFLAFCCICPFAGSIFSLYAHNGTPSISVKLAPLIVFLSSLANFFMLLYGLTSKSKYLNDWASIAHFQTNKRQHWYTLVKVLNIPFWTLACIFGFFVFHNLDRYVLWFTVSAVPCSFFIAKVILMNHVGKAANYLKQTFKRKSPSRDEKSKKTTTNEDMPLNPLNSS